MAYTFNTALPFVVSNYAEILQTKITKTSLKKALVENPHYPSLLALSDTFDKFKIPNSAYRLSAEKLFELNLDVPFIAFLNIPIFGLDFVLITKLTAQKIDYIHKNKQNSISKEAFEKHYKGIVWFAEIGEQSGEMDYENKIKAEKSVQNKNKILIATALAVGLLMVMANFSNINFVAYNCILFLKIIGIATTSLLLLHEIDKENVFIKNLCGMGSKTNCDAILNSSAAKIAGISWGEIGFFYFTATTIGLLLPNLAFQTKASWIAIANICAVPYIFFSIYYQWRIIKQWCLLCLTVQFALFLEFLWSLGLVWPNPILTTLMPFSYYTVVFCVLLPVVVWYSLKPVFVKYKNHDLYLSAYKRLQYNPRIFKDLLEQQDPITEGWQHLGIDIGNPNAQNIIVKVCNPFCGPCEKSHKHIKVVLENNQNIRLKIIYIGQNNEHKAASVVKHLMAIATQKNSSGILTALDDWYFNVEKNYTLFANKYPITDIETQGPKLDQMGQWCINAGITHTPTIFVNGYRLPEDYKTEELTHLL